MMLFLRVQLDPDFLSHSPHAGIPSNLQLYQFLRTLHADSIPGDENEGERAIVLEYEI
jgi:hypothetical protein